MVLAFTSLVPPRISRADATYLKEGAGGSVFAEQNNEIQMVRETVTARIQRAHLLDDDSQWQVECRYHFKNTSATPLRVTMGFPETFDLSEQYLQGENRLDRIIHQTVKDLKVWIGEREVPVEIKAFIEPGTLGSQTGVPRWPAARTGWQGRVGRNLGRIYTWEVEFAASQELDVKNVYSFDAKIHHPYDLGGTVFNYILKTGRFWKGRIEEARIRVEFGDLAYADPNPIEDSQCQSGWQDIKDLNHNPRFPSFVDDIQMEPPGGHVTQEEGRTVISWALKNFKPDRDIAVPYCTLSGPRRALVERVRKVPTAEIDNPGYAERLINHLLAAYGSGFEDTVWRNLFAGRHWYLRDPSFSRDLLRPEDRELLQRIETRKAELEARPGQDGGS